MSYKFFYLYLFAGVAWFGILIYHIVTSYPTISYAKLALDAVVTIWLLFRSYRIYKTKQDNELM